MQAFTAVRIRIVKNGTRIVKMCQITVRNNIKTKIHVAVCGSVGNNYERVELYRHAVNVTQLISNL